MILGDPESMGDRWIEIRRAKKGATGRMKDGLLAVEPNLTGLARSRNDHLLPFGVKEF